MKGFQKKCDLVSYLGTDRQSDSKSSSTPKNLRSFRAGMYFAIGAPFIWTFATAFAPAISAPTPPLAACFSTLTLASPTISILTPAKECKSKTFDSSLNSNICPL